MSARRLIVSISGRHVAVDLDAIQEIAERSTITLLPLLPSAVPGVISLRGTPVPLIDFGALQGDTPRHDHRLVVVADDGKRLVGLLIDGIEWIDDQEGAGMEGAERLDLAGLLEVIG